VRVLVVDDDDAFRTLVIALLTEVADVIEQAADGEAAIALAQSLRPDLVIMDITMPRTDGVTAARAIQRTVPSARLVFLSGTETERKLAEAAEIGRVIGKHVADLRAELHSLAA
jgi:DNA-binding NarL/FixJ family response regulator